MRRTIYEAPAGGKGGRRVLSLQAGGAATSRRGRRLGAAAFVPFCLLLRMITGVNAVEVLRSPMFFRGPEGRHFLCPAILTCRRGCWRPQVVTDLPEAAVAGGELAEDTGS